MSADRDLVQVASDMVTAADVLFGQARSEAVPDTAEALRSVARYLKYEAGLIVERCG